LGNNPEPRSGGTVATQSLQPARNLRFRLFQGLLEFNLRGRDLPRDTNSL